MKFTRVGYLYPVVERNSKLGLLVGVRSGGRVPIPIGDVLWRVDDRPFRELKAADNPRGAAPVAAYRTGNEAADKAMADALAMASGLSSTATVASGDRAREMLAEMLAGQSLIFRQAGAAPGLRAADGPHGRGRADHQGWAQADPARHDRSSNR
jgi:hypothetical protein